jgi:ornithine cyclodeaminase
VLYPSANSLLEDSDIFVTCTTSAKGYLSNAPREGSLILNISLRDFAPQFRQFVQYMVVDNWSEVCRHGTDIEVMHQAGGLRQADVITLGDVVLGRALERRRPQETVMFNPMGMAVFDMAVSSYYRDQATASKVGLTLE